MRTVEMITRSEQKTRETNRIQRGIKQNLVDSAITEPKKQQQELKTKEISNISTKLFQREVEKRAPPGCLGVSSDTKTRRQHEATAKRHQQGTNQAPKEKQRHTGTSHFVSPRRRATTNSWLYYCSVFHRSVFFFQTISSIHHQGYTTRRPTALAYFGRRGDGGIVGIARTARLVAIDTAQHDDKSRVTQCCETCRYGH